MKGYDDNVLVKILSRHLQPAVVDPHISLLHILTPLLMFVVEVRGTKLAGSDGLPDFHDNSAPYYKKPIKQKIQ